MERTNDRGVAASPGQQHLTASPWEFVRLADYCLPAVATRSAFAKTWSSMKRLLRSADERAQAPIKKEADLRTLPELRLQHLAPPIDWAAADEALARPGPATTC